MKTSQLNPRRAPAGHVLMTMLVATAIVGIALASYLRLTQTQQMFTARSQIWNNCIPLIEAGVEEALAQLNSAANTNLAANGWTGTSSSFYKLRQLGDGYYRVTVTCSNIIYPVIVATGYLPAPPSLASAQTPVMAAAFVPDANIKYMSRTVRVNLMKEPALTKGMVAKDKIDLGGNSCMVDSYNSSVGPYSAATAGDKGDVATNSDIIGAVGLGNAKIKGHLSTGPKATVKLGPNGRVGSVAWHAANKGGVQPGWLRRDMNLAIPDVVEPWSGGAQIPKGSGSNKYILDTGNYELTSLTLSGSQKIRVNGNAVLYVKGNINIAGDIKVAAGCKLKIYCGGTQVTLAGTYDKPDIPADFMLFGLPSVKTINVSGVAGVIYAPSAAVTLNGNSQFYGASVSKSVTMTGTTAFHYDEALAKVPEFKQYIISAWNEI